VAESFEDGANISEVARRKWRCPRAAHGVATPGNYGGGTADESERISSAQDFWRKRAKPYVYSDAEIDALLTAAVALPPAGGLRRWTYHTLFGLIAVTGMRISEAMGVERQDVDLDVGVLTVRLTRFGKSRLVPLRPTTRTATARLALRLDLLRCRTGRPLAPPVRSSLFWRLSREIGLRRPGDRTGPRVHDFRHRFAIRTLLDRYREGKDVGQQLPVLSTCLGNASGRDTYWYLSAYPELMEEAARRLDRRWEACLQDRDVDGALLHRAPHALAQC